MQRYPQRSLVRPRLTIAIWTAIVSLSIIAIAELGPTIGTQDLPAVGGAALAVLALVAVAAFRSWQGVLAAALVAVCAIAVTGGLAGVLHLSLAVPPSALVVFAAVLATLAATYLALAHRARVQFERRHPRPLPSDRGFLVSEALRDIRGTITLFSVSAAIGFIAAGLSSLAITAFATGVAVMTVAPAVFVLAPVEVAAHDRRAPAIAAACARVASGNPAMVIAVTLALVAGGGVLLRGELSAWPLGALGLAVLAIWVVSIVALGSLTLGTAAVALDLAPLLVACALLHVLGAAAGAAPWLSVIALGLLAADTRRSFKRWVAHRRRPGADPAGAIVAMLDDVGGPLLATPIIVAAGVAVLVLSGTDASVATTFAVIAATTLLARLVVLPAVLVVLAGAAAKRAIAEDMSVIGDFRKLTADEKRPRFSDYSDAEIMNLNTADFLALAGKTVIRHGGSNGTRRLLVELDIRSGSRILELGAGVGATAFDVVAIDPTVHVTGIDLSAFMVEKARERAESQDTIDRKRRSEQRTAPLNMLSPNERRRGNTQSGPDERRRNDRREEPRIGLGERVAFVHSRDPNVLPFEDNMFDVVIAESVAMYNNTERFFREVFRVLKPGGRLGLHDWCWVDKPAADLEVATCVIACGCNPGDVKFFTQADWEGSLKRQGFGIAFAEEYPFTFFSWSSMRDDEGTWRLLKMFGRVLSRGATAKRMLRMMMFLARREGMFGYTVTVAKKPEAAMVSPALPKVEAEALVAKA